MADYRTPGPVGHLAGRQTLDIGTTALRQMPAAGPVGAGGNSSVATTPLEDRFIAVLHRTLPKLPADLQEEFAAILSPAALAVIVGVLVVWAGSHYVGVGFIVDLLLLVGGFIFLGWQIWAAASDFVAFLELTCEARSEAELDQAAQHLSDFIAVVGVAAFLAILTRGAGKKIKVSAARARVMVKVASAADAGMTPRHFQAVLKVAMDPKSPRVILFRRTNPASLKYIERGFPAKPKEIKVKTSSQTGIVTCDDVADVNNVRSKLDSKSNKKYFTVDRNRRTATNGDGETIDLAEHDWDIEPGQVIDPNSKKPLVGDYDLFDVFDPKVIAGKQPGNQGNLVLATRDGRFVDDFTNPEVKRVVNDLNAAMKSDQVKHGHHGAYDSIDNLDADEIITAFMPDGTALAMNRSALRQFYAKIGRSTLDLKRWMPDP